MRHLLICAVLVAAFATLGFAEVTTQTLFVTGPAATVYNTPFSHLPALNSNGPAGTTNLLSGKAHTLVSGSWHNVFATVTGTGPDSITDNTFKVTMTNGTYENSGDWGSDPNKIPNTLVALCEDDNTPGGSRVGPVLPKTVIQYSFSPAVDIKELRIWVGHQGDSGNRARFDALVEVSHNGTDFETVAPRFRNGVPGDPPGATGESGIGYGRLYNTTGGTIAGNVALLKLSFFGCGAFGTGVFTERDWSGNNNTIIKEIEAWGNSPAPVEDWMMF